MKAKVFFKKDSVSIIFKETSGEMYFATFDYEFRLMTAFRTPNLYKRGFNNQLLLGNVFFSKSTFLSREDSIKVLRGIYEDSVDLFLSKRYQVELKQQNEDLIDYFVEKVGKTTFEDIILDGNNFEELYKPVSIIPPDQYMSLYIPITEGCSYNKCSFCNLYKNRAFRIKTEKELDTFLDKMTLYFGASLLTRRGIFLGEGNALVERTEAIIRSIELIRDKLRLNNFITFDIERPFTGFMDTFHTKKTKEELENLKNAGLAKVFIGLESGSEYILNELLMKPSNNSNLIQTVENLKDVGINVGVTVIVGVGGKELSELHVKETINLLFKLVLGKGDIIYLSPIVEYPGTTYPQLVDRNRLTRLTENEIEEQIIAMKRLLVDRFPETKVSIYRVDKFIY